MISGEKNVKILRENMAELNVHEVSGFDNSKDGLFFIVEYPADCLPLIEPSLLKRIPKELRDEALDKIMSLAPFLKDELEIPSSFKTSLRYDFVLFRVKKGNITYKTYEIQGEGHVENIFSTKAFCKTILSDLIKEKHGTKMIPLYDCGKNDVEKKKKRLLSFLQEEIKDMEKSPM